MIHGDIKLSNILIEHDEQLRLADLGVAISCPGAGGNGKLEFRRVRE